MKTLHKTLIALAAGAVMTTGAQAAVMGYGSAMTAEPYIGAKIGQYDADGAKDEAVSYGVYGGAKFTPYFGVEAEYLTTTEETSAEDSLDKTDYQGEVYGLYATYEYPFANTGGLYAKGRLGYAKNSVDVDYKDKVLDTTESRTFDDTGFAGGLGLGYDITPNAAVELAYDWYPTIEDDGTDVDVSGITLGAKLKF